MGTDPKDKIATRADDEQERVDVDELLATSKRLIDKMKMLIESAQKVINQQNALIVPGLDAKNRSEQ